MENIMYLMFLYVAQYRQLNATQKHKLNFYKSIYNLTDEDY